MNLLPLKFHHRDLSFSVFSLLRSFLVKCSQHILYLLPILSRSFRSLPRSVVTLLLFILFISGLPFTLVTTKFLMYADTTLFSFLLSLLLCWGFWIKTLNLLPGGPLQTLYLNPSKSCLLIAGFSSSLSCLSSFSISLDAVPIPRTTSV